MDYETQMEINKELSSWEHILWTDRPAPGFRLRPADYFTIPFSLLWAGFAFFWEITVILHTGFSIMALFGLPFVVYGLYLVFGRFILDAYQRRNTVYGLTDKCIMIVTRYRGRKVISIELDQIENLSYTVKKDGVGYISFRSFNIGGINFDPSRWYPSGTDSKYSPSLAFVPDVRRVCEHIRTAAEKYKSQRHRASERETPPVA